MSNRWTYDKQILTKSLNFEVYEVLFNGKLPINSAISHLTPNHGRQRRTGGCQRPDGTPAFKRTRAASDRWRPCTKTFGEDGDGQRSADADDARSYIRLSTLLVVEYLLST